jgi:formate hydrogenlyase subunit 3/multisubunit Na+/H+ antiporter MnhD subunit
MNELLYPIIIPAAAGIIPIFVPRKGKIVAGIVGLAAAVWTLLRVIRLLALGELSYAGTLFSINGGDLAFSLSLRLYHFSAFILLFIMIFGVLIILYSLGYLRGKDTSSVYYTFVLWTLAAAAGAVLTDNLLVLLIFWEMLTFMLYYLVNMGGEGHETAASKVFNILGFSDAAMLLGVLMVWVQHGTLSMRALSISTSTPLGTVAFILFFIGAIAKAGAMPLHSWVPAMAKPSLASVMAFLPASLDKLLGIYLLARLSLDVFIIEPGSALSLTMMIIGSATIIFAVLMALVQHDLKKLLSFHAVSQVGYMVLGVGSGIPIAIVGGLFHMLNNAIYKNGLFLAAGAVEKRTGTTELEELGGLARLMPVTFITTIITALAISGVPPFNGFVSKWLVYQGMLSGGYVIFLVAAIFGSALTLASFIKVLHSLFLGRRPERLEGVREVDFTMQVPMIFLAILCLLFGIFAGYPLNRFIMPIVGGMDVSLTEAGIATPEGLWSPGLATMLIVIGIIVGLVIYAFSRMRNVRVDENVWIGGNIMDNEEMRIPGTHFYKTVTDEINPVVGAAFRDGEMGAMDVYNLCGYIGGNIVQFFRSLHNGILSTYLSWCVIGLGVLAFILIFR